MYLNGQWGFFYEQWSFFMSGGLFLWVVGCGWVVGGVLNPRLVLKDVSRVF